MTAEETLVIYTDGASRGNPGKSAVGLHFPGDGTSVGKRIEDGTNNVAEYAAIDEALSEAEKRGARRVLIRSDSDLAVKQIKGDYRIKAPHLLKLVKQIRHRARDRFAEVKFEHVTRDQNKKADAAANRALDEE